jgi:hypothetical protein
MISEGETRTILTGSRRAGNAAGGRSAWERGWARTSTRGSANALADAVTSKSAATIRPFAGLNRTPSLPNIVPVYRRIQPHPLEGLRWC